MLESAKRALRTSFIRPAYLWVANRYRGLRRLIAYPETAHIGGVDYDTYWDNKAPGVMGTMSPWRQARADVFASMVSAGDKVLDLGVGDGALLKYLIDRRGIEAYGVDVSEKAVAFCHSIGLSRVVLGDVNCPISDVIRENFGDTARFDYGILSEIIEHLPDPESLLLSLAPLVHKGLIVSIPNTGFHQHRLRLLMGRFPLQWVVTPGEHLRYWTRADFHWWARQLGFRIVREVPYQGTPGMKDIMPGLFAAAFVYQLRMGK